MNKPSEKAMQCVENILHAALKQPRVGAGFGEREFHSQACLEEAKNVLNKYTTEALEAQHRKTWALAIKCAGNTAHDMGYYSEAYVNGNVPDTVYYHNTAVWKVRDAVRALPCPPIEATKDK